MWTMTARSRPPTFCTTLSAAFYIRTGKTILLARMARPRVAAFLEALYAKGNQAAKPVGSGWYLVGLNAGQCGTKQSAAFGCKFDANGNPTECGAAEINYATGELDVVVAQ